MSEFAVTIPGGESRRLKTAGKYCPADILVTSEGGAAEGLDFTDPEVVYRATRPSDWLLLPVPSDTEMYFLGHLIDGIDNQFMVKLVFSGACTIEFGNLVNGVFSVKESIVPVSGTAFYHMLNYDDYGDETADGYRQYIVRISGSNISEVLGTNVNTADTPSNIVEFVCGIPLGVFRANGSGVSSGMNKTFVNTEYIRFVGNGLPGFMSMPFANCYALKAVICESAASPSYFSYVFYNCSNLIAFSPNLLGGKVLEWTNAFSSCNILKLPNMNIKCKGMKNTFNSSTLKLFNGDQIDTSEAANMDMSFADNKVLTEVRNINISSLTSANNIFYNAINLQKLTFTGETTPGGITVKLTESKLSHTALVNMINSLPTAIASATITLTGNPGAAELTDAEIAVATARNWTVVI